MEDPEWEDDVERLRNLPAEATQEIRDYLQRLLSGQTADDPVCIWYDPATHGCRYYDHRPSTCRDFERGSDDCRNWRKDYGI